jgi:hypothetical protein
MNNYTILGELVPVACIDCASAKSMHTIVQSITNSSYKVGRFTLNPLQLNVLRVCPHLPDDGYKHCPACTVQEGKVHATLNNIAISVIVSECVNVFCYSFAGDSCEVVKFLLNRVKIIFFSKKCKRNISGKFVKFTDATHLFCFTSFWYKSVPIQVSTVMEVAKKVSESMNMFSGDTSVKLLVVVHVQYVLR